MVFVALHLWTLLLAALCVGPSLAYPTWYLATFSYRCKVPNLVEMHHDGWEAGDWRISSMCNPGTCCSNLAETGPLCTADACAKAEVERGRMLDQYRKQEALRIQQEEARQRLNAEMQNTWKGS